jgi:predicted RNase H-like HicB family nuclease
VKPLRYRIVIEWSDQDAAFVARVPALPGCAAHGKTAEEAAREARRAAEAMLAVLREDGDPLPPEDASASYSGQIRLRLPRSLHERLARVSTAEGVSLNQMMVMLLAQGSGLSGVSFGPRERGTRRRPSSRARQ